MASSTSSIVGGSNSKSDVEVIDAGVGTTTKAQAASLLSDEYNSTSDFYADILDSDVFDLEGILASPPVPPMSPSSNANIPCQQSLAQSQYHPLPDVNSGVQSLNPQIEEHQYRYSPSINIPSQPQQQPSLSSNQWDSHQESFNDNQWDLPEQYHNNEQWNVPPPGHAFWLTFPWESYMQAVNYVPNNAQPPQFGYNNYQNQYLPVDPLLMATQFPPVVKDQYPLGPLLDGWSVPAYPTDPHASQFQPQKVELRRSKRKHSQLSSVESIKSDSFNSQPSEPSSKRPRRNPVSSPQPERRRVAPRTTDLISIRTKRRQDFDAAAYYTPLSSKPASWGPPDSNGLPKFRYNNCGELLWQTYSGADLVEYFYNMFPKSNERKVPRLLIQCTPADCAKRYPNPYSDRCRFKDCPVKGNTIYKGAFRVAFDEQADSRLDPFHCAGFAHLYCMERFLDFGELVRMCNIMADTRELKEGRNRMALTRDHPEFRKMCVQHLEKLRSGRLQDGYQWVYEETLGSKLTQEHLALEPANRQKKRALKGGNHIGSHRNDLVKYVQGEAAKVAREKNVRTRRVRQQSMEEEEL